MKSHVNTFELQIAAAAQSGDEPKWIKLVPAGIFKLRDGRGPFDAGNLASMKAIIERSLAHAGGTELMIDYDHQSVFGAIQGVGGRAEAAGWIRALEARDDGIYGQVEWTPTAAGQIGEKKYRYISPLFTSAKGTGAIGRLLNAALVNMPALDLAAVAASSNLLIEDPKDNPMNAIAKALGLADTASADAILAAINERHTRIAASVGLGADATVDAIVTAASAAVAGVSKVAAAAGLKGDASADEVVNALSAHAGTMVPKATFDQVNEELTALRAGMEDKAVDEAVTAAMEDGKITPANEAWARNYAKNDLKGFQSFVDASPKLTKAQLGDKEVPASEEMDAATIAAKAQAYQDEQEAKGITVSIFDAVEHVQTEAAKGKK